MTGNDLSGLEQNGTLSEKSRSDKKRVDWKRTELNLMGIETTRKEQKGKFL